MSISDGYIKYKRFVKTSDDTSKAISHWTSSDTVEMNDGGTLEEHLGSIKGITSSLASTSENIALSASAGKELQDQIVDVDNKLSQEIAVERGRIDKFVSLPEGSTTGDAELQDIRVGYDGTLYDTAGNAVRSQIDKLSEETKDIRDTFKTTQIFRLNEFVKRGNLAKVVDYSSPNSDGTTRSVIANSSDPAKGVLSGTFHNIKVHMPLTDYISLDAGKTYSIYVYDESKIDYAMHMYNKSGGTYQENGVNKTIAKTISQPFTTITPEISDEYYIGIYLNFEASFTSSNVYVYVVEGEFTLDDFMYLYTKDEVDSIVSNMGALINVPKEIADKNINIMKSSNIVTNHIITRSVTKCTDSLSILNGSFPANTYTQLGEFMTLEADKVYTVFAVSNFITNTRILFVDSSNTPLASNGVNINAAPNGLSYITSSTGGEVKPCIYSYSDQIINTEVMMLYIIEGKYTMPDFCKYATNKIVKEVAENLSDVVRYKDEILSENLLTMTTNYVTDGSSTPSSIDKSITKLNGKIHNLRLSNEFKLVAGTTYTVCVVDNVKDVNYSIFFEDISTGTSIKVNGANKGFNVTNDTCFDIFVPDTTATVRAFIYNNNRDAVTDRYLRILVLEGAYTQEELISEKESSSSNSFDYSAYGLPLLKFFGSTTGMNKDNEVTLNYEYKDLSGTCTVKWQGSSSIAYPKKNYTVKFDNAFEAVEGWGAQKKYCLKANWIDFSHARNVVSAKLWGQIVKSRATQNEHLYDLPNGGAIDGFPIGVVINGVYQGIYTFNIPKDEWMFGMGEGETEYVVSAEVASGVTAFKEVLTLEDLQAGTYFEIEYSPDGVEDNTVLSCLNRLIWACINGNDESSINNVSQYMDMESAIDYYIFACLLCATDAMNKNYLLGTYDGTKLFMSAYDLDTTFGNVWDGKSYYDVLHSPTFASYAVQNKLMYLIYNYDKEALKTRYTELRASVLSEENVYHMFYNFVVNIPKAMFDEEVKIWTGVPGTQTNNLAQIMDFYRLRVKRLDAEIEAL